MTVAWFPPCPPLPRGGARTGHLRVRGNPELSLEQSCCDGHFGGAAPLSRAYMLGLYLTNYGGKAAFTVETMQAQCKLALDMLRSRRIFGINFLLHGAENADVVGWTRQWIRRVGSEAMTC